MKDTHGNWHLDGTVIRQTVKSGKFKHGLEPLENAAYFDVKVGGSRPVAEAEALAARIFSAMISEGVA